MDIKIRIDKFVKNIVKNVECLLLRYDASFLEKGKDIDILVESSKMKIIVKNIIDQIFENGHHLVKFHFSKLFSLVFVIFNFDNKKYPLYFEIRTIINDYVLTFKDLKRKNLIDVNEHGISTLNLNAETAVLLIRNAISNRTLSEKHLFLINGHDFSQVKTLIYELGFSVSVPKNFYGKYSVKKRQKSIFKNIYHRFLLKYCFKSKNSPLYISFYGPDGAGKSTYGKMLYDDTKLFGKIHYFHYLMNGKGGADSKSTKIEKKISMSTKFPILRFLRFLAIKNKTFFKKYKNDILVINDRFLLDYFFKFYHNSKFSVFHARVARIFSNKSNMINILIVDTPQRIITRKPELTQEQILEIYKFLNKGIKLSNGRFFEVNLEKFESIDKVYENVIENISLTNKKIFYKKVLYFKNDY